MVSIYLGLPWIPFNNTTLWYRRLYGSPEFYLTTQHYGIEGFKGVRCDEPGNSSHTDKIFRNLIKSNRNQIVFTIFRLIWNQMDIRFILNQSEKGLIIFNMISKIFLCVFHVNKYFGIFPDACLGKTEKMFSVLNKRGKNVTSFFSFKLCIRVSYFYIYM